MFHGGAKQYLGLSPYDWLRHWLHCTVPPTVAKTIAATVQAPGYSEDSYMYS